MIGRQLEELFSGTFPILAFRRREHGKGQQGRVNVSNVGFGVKYVLRTMLELVRQRPIALYLDIPKDRLSFLRTSLLLGVSRALRVRVVGDLAGADFQFLDGRDLIARFGGRQLRRLHAIRVLGPSVAETLRRRGLTNAVVVSNGIAEPPVAGRDAGPVEQELGLLYVGSVSESKGVLTLVEAMHLFARDGGRAARLDIVGEWQSDVFRERVHGLVAEAGLKESIRVHGLLVGEAKWEVFRRAHLLVHASSWDGQPVTILEAFAFGIPVVATPVGAIPDTVTDGVDGYLMRERSAAELVAGIERIATDDATYEGYATRARATWERRFSAATFESGMAALLRSAVCDALDGNGSP